MNQESPKCNICQGRAKAYAGVLVRNKYKSEVFSCSNCGYVFLAPITWLEEAYQTPITPLDVGYVSRNLAAAKYLAWLLDDRKFDNEYFVDFGGGCGLLVRLMRDRGFRFHLFDPYEQNVFAWNCDADMSVFGRYRGLCAIEVFEHLSNPREEFEKMVSFSDAIIFTTELCPHSKPQPNEWWYFGLEHGQHVSFYTSKSLRILAHRFGLSYRPLGKNWHIISPADDPIAKPMSDRKLFWATALQRRIGKLIAVSWIPQKKYRVSLIEHDHEAMRQLMNSTCSEQIKSRKNIDQV